MPVLKTEHIAIQTKMQGIQHIKVKICVSARGKFYCNLEPDMKTAVQGVFKVGSYSELKGKLTVEADTLESLLSDVKLVYKAYMEPTVKKEPVILYNIESHVAFAEDEEGNIFPNATYPNSKWKHAEEDQLMFGGHSAQQPSYGGYSLTIGGRAMLKITYSYGGKEKVEYEWYYKDGSHLGRDNPANRLNGWGAFTLGKNPKEIPYTDEAAEFFYNLMYGMAKLSQMIQTRTFDQAELLMLISSNNNLLIGR